ncbi:MAG: choice-of-anchor tandem repeat GloVer-containing protein [Candidatus Korobacteraceae bacterium]
MTPIGGGGWTQTVLHNCSNGTDGYGPSAGLIFDAAGNLYGITSQGGTYDAGTVFELIPTGNAP